MITHVNKVRNSKMGDVKLEDLNTVVVENWLQDGDLEQEFHVDLTGDEEIRPDREGWTDDELRSFGLSVEALTARMGAKSQLRGWLVTNFPDCYCYCEPFMGSGKVLLWKTKKSRVEMINDIDLDMANFLHYARKFPHKFAAAVNDMPVHEGIILGLREALAGRKLKGLERAIAFYVGTQSVFNAKGVYTSYGSSPHVLLDTSIDVAKVLKVSERLRRVDIRCTSYERIIRGCNKYLDPAAYPPGGVFFYLDPPYWSTTGYTTFQGETSFGWTDQVKLAELCFEIHRVGNRFIQTNSYHPDLLKLYGSFLVDGKQIFHMESRDVYYSLAGKGEDREEKKEVVISNFPLAKQRDLNKKQGGLF